MDLLDHEFDHVGTESVEQRFLSVEAFHVDANLSVISINKSSVA